jgi:hypothetical protein
MVATDTHATIEKMFKAVLSVRSVTRLYNEGQLPLEKSLEKAIRRVGGWCEMDSSMGVSQLEQLVSCEAVSGQ